MNVTLSPSKYDDISMVKYPSILLRSRYG